jgi:hypothetical protein
MFAVSAAANSKKSSVLTPHPWSVSAAIARRSNGNCRSFPSLAVAAKVPPGNSADRVECLDRAAEASIKKVLGGQWQSKFPNASFLRYH